MPIVWGAYQGALRVGVDCYVLNPNPSYHDSSVTVRCDWYVAAYQNYEDNQTLNYGGNSSGSTNFYNGLSDNNTYQQMLVSTRDQAVGINFGSGGSVTYTGTISGAYNGVTPSVSVTIGIPARPYYPPTAPGVPAPSRISDYSHSMVWGNNSNSGSIYSYQNVQRADFFNGYWHPWATVGTVNGSTGGFIDNSTGPDRMYSWRVEAVNPSGSAISSSSVDYRTTPFTPVGCSAAKTGIGDILVTWTNVTAVQYYTTRIEESTDGGSTWTFLASVIQGVTSWTHVSPNPALTHRYRVRHRTTSTDSGGVDLDSPDWSVSGIVQLLTNPGAPSGVRILADVPAFDAAQGFGVGWTHVSIDTSPQSAYEVNYRLVGAGSWSTTGKIDGFGGGDQNHFFNPGVFTNGTQIEVRVRTWGAFPDPGPYSSPITLQVSARPTAAINSPLDGSTYDNSNITVEWGYFDAESTTQTGYRVELYDSLDRLVNAYSGTGIGSQWTLLYGAENGTSWRATVRVRDGHGMWSETVETTFSIEYPLPPVPTVTATWDTVRAAVALEVTVPGPVDDEVDADYFHVYRITDGRALRILEYQEFTPGEPVSVTDPVPFIGADQTNRYVVAAIAGFLPSTSYSTELQVPGMLASAEESSCSQLSALGEWVYLNGGDYYTVLAKLRAGLQTSRARARARVLRHFVGREHPLEFLGEQVTERYSLAGVTEDIQYCAPDDWEALQDVGAPLCLRDHYGRRLFVSLGDITTSPVLGRFFSLSTELTVVGDSAQEATFDLGVPGSVVTS